jgi:hypothetical protein
LSAKSPGPPGGDEVAGFEARLDVGILLAAAGLEALADDQLAAVGAHFKHAAFGDLQHVIVGIKVQRAAIGPGLGEHAAHALVKIDHHPGGVLFDDGEAREQPPGGQIFRDHEAPGGFVHVHAVGKLFKPHNFPGQAMAGGRLGLGDQGGAEQIVFAEAVLGDGQVKLVGHLEFGRDRLVGGGQSRREGRQKHGEERQPQLGEATKDHPSKMPSAFGAGKCKSALGQENWSIAPPSFSCRSDRRVVHPPQRCYEGRANRERRAPGLTGPGGDDYEGSKRSFSAMR